MNSDSHGNDPRFVEYYEQESRSERARERARGILSAVMRARRKHGVPTDRLRVADIGCNAGTQSRVWLEVGHRVSGLDISRDLVAIARQRNAEFGDKATFEVGSATSLHWADDTFDVCLLPELLEHVDDWESCVREAVRVLRPGGSIYLSTTNVLCPVQQEFTLPAYSWYPGWVKRRVVARAMSDAPQLANFASYPAVHWFSPYGLERFLRDLSVRTMDRFDLIDTQQRGAASTSLIWAIRTLPPLRFVGHCLTPGTTVVGQKVAPGPVGAAA